MRTTLVYAGFALATLAGLPVAAQSGTEPLARFATAAQAPNSSRPLDWESRLEVQDVTLEEALMELGLRSGVSVVFSPSAISKHGRVSCDCSGLTVGEALDHLLRGAAFRRSVLGDQVVIEPGWSSQVDAVFSASVSPPTISAMTTVFRPEIVVRQGTVTGLVTERMNFRPVELAQVYIAGLGRGTLTDGAGRFTLLEIPAGTHTLRVERLGFQAVSQEIEVRSGQTLDVNFELSSLAVALDELVVTATGQQRAREIGTSLARITSREIEAAPVRNTQDLLAGRTPGATVFQNSGQPGAGGAILLRGNNSISQGNSPLIYIDGVRVFGGSSPTAPQGNQRTNPLNDISAEDIERVEVIKGAAATTLYGTEASGGVIQIFTRRGQSGAPRWTADITMGLNNMGHVGTKADPTGMWLNQCRGPNNRGWDGRVFEDITCPDAGTWLKSGMVQRYSVGVSGGGDALSYYLSGNADDEQGVIRGAGGTTGGGFLGNFVFTPVPSLELSLNSSFSRREVEWLPQGDNGDAFMLNVTRAFGSNFGGASGCSQGVICVQNGRLLDIESFSRNTHFITGLTAIHRVGESVSNRVTVGYDYNTSEMQSVRPFGYPRYVLGDMVVRDWRQTLFSLDYVGTWNWKPEGNRFASSFAWGGQLFTSDGRTLNVNAFDFSGPGKPTLTSAARRDVTQDSRQRVTNAGFFLQETLAWRDLLFITGGARIDGNSAFGEDFGLQIYPKVSASWVLSDEPFWFEDRSWIETVKLRAAMGESGKAPGAFDAVRTWNPVAGDNGAPGFTPGQIGNANLGPERTREVEVGFEAGFLEGRVGIDYTYFTARTFDALIPVQSPPSMGFAASQLENVGEIVNQGTELRVTFDLLRRPRFDWRVRFDYSTVRSEAVDLAGQLITVQTFGRTGIREGYPVPGIFGAKIMNPNEFADPVWEQNAYIGPIYPTRSIGLNTNFTIADRVVVDALGEFRYGGHMINGNAYQNSSRGAWFPCYEVQAKDDLRRAGDPSAMNDVTALERARCARTGGAVAPSYDAWIESTDFFKLRSISLSYQIPSGWIPGASNASLQVAGRNLWTHTDYTGSDPELDQYPTSLARRDYYVLPTYRTFQMTLKATF